MGNVLSMFDSEKDLFTFAELHALKELGEESNLGSFLPFGSALLLSSFTTHSISMDVSRRHLGEISA